jgi:hypothetical protein
VTKRSVVVVVVGNVKFDNDDRWIAEPWPQIAALLDFDIDTDFIAQCKRDAGQ